MSTLDIKFKQYIRATIEKRKKVHGIRCKIYAKKENDFMSQWFLLN